MLFDLVDISDLESRRETDANIERSRTNVLVLAKELPGFVSNVDSFLGCLRRMIQCFPRMGYFNDTFVQLKNSATNQMGFHRSSTGIALKANQLFPRSLVAAKTNRPADKGNSDIHSRLDRIGSDRSNRSRSFLQQTSLVARRKFREGRMIDHVTFHVSLSVNHASLDSQTREWTERERERERTRRRSFADWIILPSIRFSRT